MSPGPRGGAVGVQLPIAGTGPLTGSAALGWGQCGQRWSSARSSLRAPAEACRHRDGRGLTLEHPCVLSADTPQWSVVTRWCVEDEEHALVILPA